MDNINHLVLGKFTLDFDNQGVTIIHQSNRQFRINDPRAMNGPWLLRNYGDLFHAILHEEDTHAIPAALLQYEVRRSMSGEEIDKTIRALLGQLPKSYPPATFSITRDGYRLEIDRTIIFQGASGEDAIKHTKNYVEARKEHPTLPIGVIYGIYD